MWQVRGKPTGSNMCIREQKHIGINFRKLNEVFGEPESKNRRNVKNAKRKDKIKAYLTKN